MAWVSAGSLLLNDAYALNDAKNKKVGVQLYTLRNEISKDAIGTLKKVAALGFGEVENFGYGGKFFGMSAAEYKTVLGDLGMTAPSGHYMTAILETNRFRVLYYMVGKKQLKMQPLSVNNTWWSPTSCLKNGAMVMFTRKLLPT
jgi:hypothetical protein